LEQVTVSTDVNGQATFSTLVDAVAGTPLTATATNTATGDSSEFSETVYVYEHRF
jgi:hypothetical protein